MLIYRAAGRGAQTLLQQAENTEGHSGKRNYVLAQLGRDFKSCFFASFRVISSVLCGAQS